MPNTKIDSQLIKDLTIESVDIKDGAVVTSKLTIDADLNLNNKKIVNLADPINIYDAATKNYVDAHSSSLPSGTLGQTLRNDGTNWVANSVLYNDGTNIGIGTTAPSEKLEVNGNIKVANSTILAYGDANTIMFNSSVYGNYAFTIRAKRVSSGLQYDIIQYNYSSGGLFLYPNGAVFFPGSGVWGSLGVGIGTQAPSEKLHVVGNIGISAGANAFIGTKDNYALSLRTNNLDRIFIDNVGNVGVGTTSPAYNLDVIGSIRTTGYIKEELPSTNLTATGTIITITAGENLSPGDVSRCNSDGKFYKANATNSTGVPATVMAIDTISANSTGRALLTGFWIDTSKNWTVGGYIYLSTTSGQITQTAPSGSGNQVQLLGIATATDTIYFNPNIMVIEVA